MPVFLRRVRLRNFKAVADADVTLAPLTVLVGANSSGKSTLLQSLLLQSQAAESGVRGDLYPLNGPLVRLGDFNDVLWSGAAADGPSARLGIGGETDVWDDDGAPELTGNWISRLTPRHAWELQFEGAASASRSAMRVATSSMEDLTDHFAVLVAGAEASEARHDRFAESAEADSWESWTIDVDGTVGRPDEGQTIEAVELNAGLPRQVLVAAPAYEAAAESWVRTARRVLQRGRTSAGRRGNTSADQLRLEMENLRRRLSDAQRRGDLEAASMLEERLARIWLDLRRSEAANLAERQREPSAELSAQLRAWAIADTDRLVQDRIPFGDVDRSFRRYFRERATQTTLPDPDMISTDLLSEVAINAMLAIEGETLARYDGSDLIEEMVDGVLKFFKWDLRYLGPLRESPRPNYDAVPNSAGGDIGPKGEATAAVLYACRDRLVVNPSIDGNATWLPLWEAVDQWLEYLDLGSSLATADMGRLGIELTVEQQNAGRHLDLTAVGVGVSQVLPVLALCLLSTPGTLILLEQPELHLHPKTQQRLADFLLACVRSGRQIIVETHSDHLVSRLRYRVAADPTNRVGEFLGVLFAESGERGTSYRAVEINELGGVEDWPKGFFDQAAEESQAILRAGLAKRKAREAAEEAQ